MGRARGPQHSEVIKRGLARRKAVFERAAADPWKSCHHCGKRFDPATYTGPSRLYCSNACRQAAYRDRRRQVPTGRTCWQCGRPLPEDGSYRREYCSNACRQAAYRERRQP
jgi:predicted nucleic acid-binding Zn ribbon protein